MKQISKVISKNIKISPYTPRIATDFPIQHKGVAREVTKSQFHRPKGFEDQVHQPVMLKPRQTAKKQNVTDCKIESTYKDLNYKDLFAIPVSQANIQLSNISIEEDKSFFEEFFKRQTKTNLKYKPLMDRSSPQIVIPKKTTQFKAKFRYKVQNKRKIVLANDYYLYKQNLDYIVDLNEFITVQNSTKKFFKIKKISVEPPQTSSFKWLAVQETISRSSAKKTSVTEPLSFELLSHSSIYDALSLSWNIWAHRTIFDLSLFCTGKINAHAHLKVPQITNYFHYLAFTKKLLSLLWLCEKQMRVANKQGESLFIRMIPILFKWKVQNRINKLSFLAKNRKVYL